MKEEQVLNVFEESAERASDLNKLVSVTCNDKGPIPLLDEPCKAPVVKWKVEDTSVDKLINQMKALTLALKIAPMISASAPSYPPVVVSQPAVVYTSWMNFGALAAAAAAAGNLKSAVIALGPNQCAFCQLEGHQKLWNEEPSCPSLVMFIQTGKMHLNVNKQITWETTDKSGSKVAFDTHRKKCQAETVKKALKNLPEPQQHTVGVKFFNVYAFLLRMHPSDISDSEEEAEEELVSVNAAHQQPSKVVL